MANGKTHARVGSHVLILLVALAWAWAFTSGSTATILGFICGAILGLLVTPDIDHIVRTYEEKRMYQMAGPMVGRLWQAYWSPYAILIPHRHWLSHLPGVGTAIRIAYLCWPLFFFAPVRSPQFWFWLWLAMTVQDTAHLALDGWKMR